MALPDQKKEMVSMIIIYYLTEVVDQTLKFHSMNQSLNPIFNNTQTIEFLFLI